jgi:17beta-estradiol 17-dehydrogenase / very-long-chain 3-oxoacyl-CoA reductase
MMDLFNKLKMLMHDPKALVTTPESAITTLAFILLTLSVLKLILSFVRFMWIYFIRTAPDLRRLGKWAVITGCTDGIGLAYAHALAKKGLDLVLISRTQSRLDDCAAELSSKYNIETKICAVDLCTGDTKTFDKIAATLQGLEVGILINNAGMSYDHPEYLDQLTPQDIINLININILTPTILSRLVLPGMRERSRGAIVNLGSGSGLLPSCPLLSVYAASKAYINHFSKSMYDEFASSGVTVQDQAPFFVTTKLSKIKRARLDAPSPKVWANAAVRVIGRGADITPYWFHGLMLAVMHSIPVGLATRYVMDMHHKLRAAYYRKQARLATEAAVAAVSAIDKKKKK